MAEVWSAEEHVDEERARQLIRARYREPVAAEATLVSEGWDYAVFRVDGDWAFRFPRREAVVTGMEREIAVLPALATTPWRRLRSAVRQLPEAPTDPELHRIRILAKRARYAAEAVAPVAGPGAVAFAKAAAKLQTILGEHQDSVTAQAWLRAARVTGRRAFVAGELIALESLAASDARAKWKKAWDALDRKRLRDWMP